MNITTLLATVAAMSLPITPAFAQVLYTSGHVDIGLAEEDGVELHIHDEDNDLEFAPDEAAFFIDPVLARVTRPTDNTNLAFTGVQPGADFWLFPAIENPNLPFVGVGAEEAAPDTFSSWNPGDSRLTAGSFPYLRLTLDAVNGPDGGQFAIYEFNQFGDAVVWMSTFASPTAGNHLYVTEGDHRHFNYSFSSLGTYQVTFTVSGYVGGTDPANFVSDTATYTFTSVPEPSTYGVIAAAALFVFVAVRHGRRSAARAKSPSSPESVGADFCGRSKTALPDRSRRRPRLPTKRAAA